MENGKIVLPRDDFFNLRDGLAAVVNDKYAHAQYFLSGFSEVLTSFCVFPSRLIYLYACFLLYFLLVFSWRAEPLKRKTKKAAAPKPAAAQGGGKISCGGGGSGMFARARRWDT